MMRLWSGDLYPEERPKGRPEREKEKTEEKKDRAEEKHKACTLGHTGH